MLPAHLSLRFRAFITMLIMDAIALLPYALCRSLVQRWSGPRDRLGVPEGISPEDIVTAVNTASRFAPRGDNCLVRALTGQVLMARSGFASQLLLGVAKSPIGHIERHA